MRTSARAVIPVLLVLGPPIIDYVRTTGIRLPSDIPNLPELPDVTENTSQPPRQTLSPDALHYSFSQDRDRVARFEQEARAAGTLNHPNVLAVYDVGVHDGRSFVVSELLEGQTLRDRIQGGPLPVRKAVELGVQIAQVLAAAHDKGIVHRDLKPENVFVGADGRVKILDFGLAKQTRPLGTDDATATSPHTAFETDSGAVMGTAGYMSPEQVLAQPLDARSDLFSFGVVLFETLSGQRAFQRPSAVETMNAILKEGPPDLAGLVPGLPPKDARTQSPPETWDWCGWGYAAQTGQPRIALDVGADAVFFDNPDLPNTRSEAALPLMSRGETIGILDVQSTAPGAFSNDDLQTLTALANQVSIAFENARLLTETRAALTQVQASV